MENLIEKLNKRYENKYSFLKVYEVIYDKSNSECVITFLYPYEINEITTAQRKEIREFLTDYLKISAKIVVKFKKSYLDERLIKKEVFDFISQNFKAGAVYISEKQIEVKNQEDFISIKLSLGFEIKRYFENAGFSSKLLAYLVEKFIANFDIELVCDEKYVVSSEIGEVEVPVLERKNDRYDAFIVKKLIGNNIAPAPEFIKDNKMPKTNLILAGTIEDLQKKTFTRKTGKLAGQEKYLYSFNLNDGKKMECVYFCSKTNLKKMDCLANGMTILCLGNLKPSSFNNKMTYYVSRIALATIDEESKKPKKNIDLLNHKHFVKPEEFVVLKQGDIFAKQVSYNDYIMNNTFVVYDLETTGIDPNNDRIIEIGAVKIEKGKVTQKFSTFVNPEMPIPAEATKVNNITDKMVENAPKINDAILDFFDFIKSSIVSGYNNINFDNKFISKVAKDLNLPFENENIDVYNLVKEKHIQSKNYKLTTVAPALGISLEGAHRAYNDAFATAQILLKLNEI